MLERRPARPGPKRFPPVRTAVTAVLVLAALATLVSLGNWQVRRLHWKEGLLAKIGERMHAPAVPLAEVERIQRQGGDIEYRHVRLHGTFDNSKERHFLATFEGASGFFVYTPLTTDDGAVIFVNRGFVPYDRKAPGHPAGKPCPGAADADGARTGSAAPQAELDGAGQRRRPATSSIGRT